MKCRPKFDTQKISPSVIQFNNRYYFGVRTGATPTPNTLSVHLTWVVFYIFKNTLIAAKFVLSVLDVTNAHDITKNRTRMVPLRRVDEYEKVATPQIASKRY